jgi:hypothetical protein
MPVLQHLRPCCGRRLPALVCAPARLSGGVRKTCRPVGNGCAPGRFAQCVSAPVFCRVLRRYTAGEERLLQDEWEEPIPDWQTVERQLQSEVPPSRVTHSLRLAGSLLMTQWAWCIVWSPKVRWRTCSTHVLAPKSTAGLERNLFEDSLARDILHVRLKTVAPVPCLLVRRFMPLPQR